LTASRVFNAREEITGLLVAGGNRYLQVIEGPDPMVDSFMQRIRRDQRHVGVTVMVSRKIAKRSFSDWSLAYYDEPRLGDYETLTQLIARLRAAVPERNIRDQIDCFERRFVVAATAPIEAMASPWTVAARYKHA